MSTRRRVCLLVDTVGHNAGAELQVTETALRLDRERYDVHLSCLEASPRLQDLAAHCHVQVFPTESIYTLNGAQQLWKFRRYLSDNQIQIVHTYMEKSAIFGVLAAIGLRQTAVVTSRLNMGYWYTPFYRTFFRFLNRFSRRIVANSESVKQVTVRAERAAPEKFAVIYQGVDTGRYSATAGNASTAAAIGIPADADVVGIVANLRPVKDLELFLRAARLVADAIPRAAFLIVGTGDLRPRLGELADALNLSGSVFFADGRGAVPDYLRRMCIGCLTSQSEGFSNAILEYMAAGLPVVATDVGGNREAIVHGKTGLLVPDRLPQTLAQALIELLRDPARRAAMGRQGLERCRNLFDLRFTLQRLEDFYNTLS